MVGIPPIVVYCFTPKHVILNLGHVRSGDESHESRGAKSGLCRVEEIFRFTRKKSQSWRRLNKHGGVKGLRDLLDLAPSHHFLCVQYPDWNSSCEQTLDPLCGMKQKRLILHVLWHAGACRLPHPKTSMAIAGDIFLIPDASSGSQSLRRITGEEFTYGEWWFSRILAARIFSGPAEVEQFLLPGETLRTRMELYVAPHKAVAEVSQ